MNGWKMKFSFNMGSLEGKGASDDSDFFSTNLPKHFPQMVVMSQNALNSTLQKVDG